MSVVRKHSIVKQLRRRLNDTPNNQNVNQVVLFRYSHNHIKDNSFIQRKLFWHL